MGKRSGPKTTTHFVSNKPPFYDKRLSVPPSFSRSLRPWSEQLFCSRGIVGLCCCGNASSYASCSASWCQHRHWQPRWKQHHRFTPYHGISLAWRQDTLCISVSRCLHSVCVCVCVCVCDASVSWNPNVSLCPPSTRSLQHSHTPPPEVLPKNRSQLQFSGFPFDGAELTGSDLIKALVSDWTSLLRLSSYRMSHSCHSASLPVCLF